MSSSSGHSQFPEREQDSSALQLPCVTLGLSVEKRHCVHIGHVACVREQGPHSSSRCYFMRRGWDLFIWLSSSRF